MSLETPDKIRNLQRKLYCKAKAEPAFRFYLLYDKICREDILRHAYALARANAGAPGVDGVTFKQIDASGVEAWLAGLREDLVSKTYRPDPVRRVTIPKPGGGERPLGIPTIRDRVVQTAAKIVLEPIFTELARHAHRENASCFELGEIFRDEAIVNIINACPLGKAWTELVHQPRPICRRRGAKVWIGR